MFKKKFIILLALCCINLFAEPKTFHFSPNDLQKTQAADISKEIENLDKSVKTDLPQIEYKGAFFKMVLSLIAILVLGGITIWSLKRITKSRLYSANMNYEIKILEKRVLSPKSILYLIEYDGKRMIVSESQLDMRIKSVDYPDHH
jgi:flagellar biogenesis protein FliO